MRVRVGQQPSSVIESPVAAPGPHVGEAWPLCQSPLPRATVLCPAHSCLPVGVWLFGSGSRSQLALPVHTPSRHLEYCCLVSVVSSHDYSPPSQAAPPDPPNAGHVSPVPAVARFGHGHLLCDRCTQPA
eukprot:1633779-Prymnesium_polylepis.1